MAPATNRGLSGVRAVHSSATLRASRADAIAAEGVRLDDVGAGSQEGLVDVGDDVGAGQ
jgi:hypothetical protein